MSVAGARFWTVDPYSRGRSLGSCGSVHRNRNGFGCQTAFASYAENSLRIASHLFLGAESLRQARLVAYRQEFNSVVSHITIAAPSEPRCRVSNPANAYLPSPHATTQPQQILRYLKEGASPCELKTQQHLP